MGQAGYIGFRCQCRPRADAGRFAMSLVETLGDRGGGEFHDVLGRPWLGKEAAAAQLRVKIPRDHGLSVESPLGRESACRLRKMDAR